MINKTVPCVSKKLFVVKITCNIYQSSLATVYYLMIIFDKSKRLLRDFDMSFKTHPLSLRLTFNPNLI